MNDSEAKALGLRAVACPGWRWLPGMLARWDRPPGAGGQQVLPTEARVAELPMGPLSLMFCLVDPAAVYPGSWPEFRDPATLGCLLALVREAWGMWIGVRESPALVGPPIYAAHSHRHYATEAEALVAALEAAAARVPQ